MSFDTLIIGGGAIGLSIARELDKRGARGICVVDKGPTGREASWAAAGMLGPQAEADEFGTFYQMCCASRDLYPGLAAALLDETGVDIELEQSGTLALGFTDEDGHRLIARCNDQRAAGLNVELLSSEEVLRLEPSVSVAVQKGLYFAGDWQVENRLLLKALRSYADIHGIEIRENTAVDSLLMNDGRVVGAETSKGTIAAHTTVAATGAWTSLIKVGRSAMPFDVEPVRGQIVCLRSEPGRFRHVIHTGRGYIVPRVDGRVLLGSTSEHVGFEKRVTDDAVRGLMEMAAEVSPSLTGDPLDSWSGLRPFAAGGEPVLGEISGLEGLFIAAGHYRNGILLAPLTGEIAADWILDRNASEFLTAFGLDWFIKGAANTTVTQ